MDNHYADALRIVASWPKWKQNIGHKLDLEVSMNEQTPERFITQMRHGRPVRGVCMNIPSTEYVRDDVCNRLIQQAVQVERERCRREEAEPLRRALILAHSGLQQGATHDTNISANGPTLGKIVEDALAERIAGL